MIFNELLYSWPIIIALIMTGLLAGILAGLLGVGGGIVIVPVLYFVLQIFDVSAGSAIEIAVATSLATIVPTAISSITAHARKGNIDTEILKRWSLFIFIFSMLGSYLVIHVNSTFLTLLFGVIAVLVSLNMLLRAKAPAYFSELPNKPAQGVLASLIGLLSSMVGIGGGTLGVPTLTAFNVPAHKAVGTAAVFGLVIALPAAILLFLMSQAPIDAPYGNYGLINIPAFVIMVPLTVLFAPVGAAIGEALDQAQLKKAFAVVLLITGGRMLFQAL
ncbi:sulfite exporter TauE/SafE family protein [Leucothrix sargassi]|nr:sulfite exporter TauE/SafE family protein [Leucothrix sargassi]